MITYNYYAGIGSRKTPAHIYGLIQRIAYRLDIRNWCLRSGGANGADSAFATYPGKCPQIFLPWPGFNNCYSPNFERPTSDAYNIAAQFHPAWHKLSPAARSLMARNSHQILGPDLKSPSKMVICWTPDGCESHAARSIHTGGTGQAISIADHHGIPIFNLFHTDAIQRIGEFINQNYP